MEMKKIFFLTILFSLLILILGCQKNETLELNKESNLFNDDTPFVGNENAKVTMVYYYDYQCRWCKDFDLNTYPKLTQFTQDETLKILFKDIFFIGPDSVKSATAAKCAYKKFGMGKFLDYHRMLYEGQKAKNTGWVTDELIFGIAEELSLDKKVFTDCLISGEYASELKANTDEARLNGITSTPSFIINDLKFSGSLPFETFVEIIENAKTTE